MKLDLTRCATIEDLAAAVGPVPEGMLAADPLDRSNPAIRRALRAVMRRAANPGDAVSVAHGAYARMVLAASASRGVTLSADEVYCVLHGSSEGTAILDTVRREVARLRAEVADHERVLGAEAARADVEAEAAHKADVEVARLRALLPEVEAHWAPAVSGWSRPWQYVCDEFGASVPAMRVVEPDADGPLEWAVCDATGCDVESGTASTLEAAKTAAEDAARRLGVLR